MKNTKRTLMMGIMVAGAVFGTIALQAAENNNSIDNKLNTVSVTTADLQNQAIVDLSNFIVEYPMMDDTAKTTKTTEMKCGDGKCGDSKTTEKKDAKATPTTTDTKAKSADGKCGDGKCGDSKATESKEAKTSKDAKCGDGKCGAE